MGAEITIVSHSLNSLINSSDILNNFLSASVLSFSGIINPAPFIPATKGSPVDTSLYLTVSPDFLILSTNNFARLLIPIQTFAHLNQCDKFSFYYISF